MEVNKGQNELLTTNDNKRNTEYSNHKIQFPMRLLKKSHGIGMQKMNIIKKKNQ